MANFIKEKKSNNVQVNFNQSKEVAYWSKKYNMQPATFQELFQKADFSIAKMFSLGYLKNTRATA